MKQKDKVLALLREAGPYGIHTFELRSKYIGNPSERIRELEADGHEIDHGPKERLHGQAVGVRYRLIRDAETGLPPLAPPLVQEQMQEPEVEQPALFGLAPSNAIFGEAA